MVVEAAMTVDTRELSCGTVGFVRRSLSTAMEVKAVLSSTTTASALRVSLLSVKMLLYGCTTTSE